MRRYSHTRLEKATNGNPGMAGPWKTGTGAYRRDWHRRGTARTIRFNKTRQGYARERTLKPAGYFFVAPAVAVPSPAWNAP